MHLYTSLGFYAFQILAFHSVFATNFDEHIICVLYIVAILSLVLVRETSLFIYW